MEGNNATFLLEGKKWTVSKGYVLKGERYFESKINVTDEETCDQDLKWLFCGYWLDHHITELCEQKPGRYSGAFPSLPLT